MLFRSVQKKEPNRFNAFAGAALAADKAGDPAKARANYQKLLDMVGDAKSDRPALALARAYLARK